MADLDMFSGSIYKSFEVVRVRPVPELTSTLVEVLHRPSGARIIHIQNDDESEVETSITDFAINGKLDPDKTRIHLPEGTKIIDNDEVVETVGRNGKIVPEQFVKSRQTVENVVVVEPLAEPKPAEGAAH